MQINNRMKSSAAALTFFLSSVAWVSAEVDPEAAPVSLNSPSTPELQVGPAERLSITLTHGTDPR